MCDDKNDDIERLRNNNKYKLVHTHCTASQAVNDISCINSCHSPIVLCAGSNRAIEVVDFAHGKTVLEIEDAHSRAVHTLAQCAPSAYVSHPREAHELFATSAADNAVKLWDLRTARCVRCFTGHKNCQINTGVAFSPCLRFIASGSEDKVAYLYDLRMGTLLHRIRGSHGDMVADVAFNPLHPQLATACLDGRVHFYSSEM